MALASETRALNGDVRRVESVMGTTVSVAVRTPLVPDEVLDRFFEQLRAVDARFSPYRPGPS